MVAKSLAMAGLVPLVALTFAGDPAAPATFDDLTADAAAVPLTAMGNCGACKNCTGGHDMSESGNRAAHGCYNNTCGVHPKCGDPDPTEEQDYQEVEDLSALFAAAQAGDVLTLQEALLGNPTQLSLNVARNSIQVRTCDVLTANVPLSNGVADVLAQLP